MVKVQVEDQLAAIEHLRALALSPLREEALHQMPGKLRPLLQHANNLIVARAADLGRELDLRSLTPDMQEAFERFLENTKKDPQCWAKNSLSKALHHVGCEDATLFLSGMRLHQYEPVWGGRSDVAGTLRANCAHALVDCHQLTHQALLLHLLELIADPDRTVRSEAIRAITAAGGDSAILLLRMRAVMAFAEENLREDPMVIGQCFAGLLALEGKAAISFVAQFLAKQDDLSAEAAVALGETHTPEALSVLLQCLHPMAKAESSPSFRTSRLRNEALLEPFFATTLLSAIALTRQPEAVTSLLKLIAEESSYAEAALEALASASYGLEVNKSVADTVMRLGSARLMRTYEKNFPG